MKKNQIIGLAILNCVLLASFEVVDASMRRVAGNAGATVVKGIGGRSEFTHAFTGVPYVLPNEKDAVVKILANNSKAKIRVVGDNPNEYMMARSTGVMGHGDRHVAYRRLYAPVSEVSLDPNANRLISEPAGYVQVSKMDSKYVEPDLTQDASPWIDLDVLEHPLTQRYRGDILDPNKLNVEDAVNKILNQETPLIASRVVTKTEPKVDGERFVKLSDWRDRLKKQRAEDALLQPRLELEKIAKQKEEEANKLKARRKLELEQKMAQEAEEREKKSRFDKAKLAVESDFDNLFGK